LPCHPLEITCTDDPCMGTYRVFWCDGDPTPYCSGAYNCPVPCDWP
jgi:hypothetical protein